MIRKALINLAIIGLVFAFAVFAAWRTSIGVCK